MSAAPQLGPSCLRVLLVGEQEEDFFLLQEILDRNRSVVPAQLDHAGSLAEATSMLQRCDYGLILFAHETGDAAATKLLSEFVNARGTIPFILLTENADEKSVAELIQAGAWDCMDRARINGADLMRTIRCAVSLHALQQQNQVAEEAVRTLSCAVEKSPDPVFMTDSQGVILSVNHAFEALTGYSQADAAGKPRSILKSEMPVPTLYRELWEIIRAPGVTREIVVNRKKNSDAYYVDERVSPIRNAQGNVTHFVCNYRNLTERLRIEAELVQSQKMDAVGRLAGGVAHDFNNLLTIIISYSELALDTVPPGSLGQSRIQEILSAARRATELTRQLLAFSRKQPQALRVADLNPAVSSIVTTLRRLIGEDIELTFVPGAGLGPVRFDPVQIEQILLNLAANSRDAMPRGGRLTIETSDAHLDQNYADSKAAAIPPGRYAVLTVSDTGAGMSAEHLSHLFEPFFTTKPAGKGTGLGLATVYGIVKQNHGFICVYSEVGLGTTFKIYLPCVQCQTVSVNIPEKAVEVVQRGSETVLLVEDEEALRKAAAEFLQLRGYNVLQAQDGLEALSVSKNHEWPIDLVVTDVVMPYMSGGELADELKIVRPDTRMLFVSGYTGQTMANHKVADVDSHFLSKPFTLKQLADKMRSVLSSPAIPLNPKN
ncbi:MAG: response regulator [Candidatus Sulfotelmatobacter sp.]